MQFKQAGNKERPVILLLHGGGLSWWSFAPVIKLLRDEYHIVTPILDGHGEDGAEPFMSIEAAAEKLIAYIDTAFGGHVFALGGLSIGAQIALELLSRRPDIASYAVLESALVLPMKGVRLLAAPMYRLCYGLTKRKWFSRLQANALCLPESMFEAYYMDGQNISCASLISMALSNSSYSLKPSAAQIQAKTLIIVGEQELTIMKRSAQMLHTAIPQAERYVAPAMKHGELSLLHPEKYVMLLRAFFSGAFHP